MTETAVSEGAQHKPAPFVWGPHADDAASYPAPEAFLCIASMAAVIDRHMGKLEQMLLQVLTRRWAELGIVREQDIEALNRAVVARLAEGAEAALGPACTALPHDVRPAAFAEALEIMLCDGPLCAAESAFADKLRDKLALGADEAQRISEVLTLKNSH